MKDGEDSFERFVSVARDYCSLVESLPKISREELLSGLYRVLPALIGAGVGLRLGEPDSEKLVSEQIDQTRVPEWSSLYSALDDKLARPFTYWTVFNPLVKEEPVCGSLADDIADIYGDIKKGLVGLEENLSKRDIEWEWRFTFESHWGKHAIEALMVLHQVLHYDEA